MNAKDRMDIIADALTTPADEPCPRCWTPGPTPNGVVLDGNGRTTQCPVCWGRGYVKATPEEAERAA